MAAAPPLERTALAECASSDLHPHDRLLSEFFNELLIAKRELEDNNASLSSALVAAAIGSAGSSLTEMRLRTLLESRNFITALPFLLERLNTPVELFDLPRRGRSRNQDRAELDTFYTPIDLARWIASLTTRRVCAAIQANISYECTEDSLLETLYRLSELRVGDFSCGSGVLLREAAEWIARSYESIHSRLSLKMLDRLPDISFRFFKRGFFRLQCLSNNVYGIDIGEKSLEAAKLVLLLWAGEELRQCSQEFGIVSALLALNLRLGSGSHWDFGASHVAGEPEIRSVCNQHAERRSILRAKILSGGLRTTDTGHSEIVYLFPEAFIGANPGFGCIVGNPPYGDLPLEIESQVSKSLFDGIPNTNRSRNQYTKFASSLVHLLSADGFGAIILPLGFAYVNSETKILRRQIQNQPRSWTFAFFDRSPDSLFGDSVKTRNVVMQCEPSLSGAPEIKTTKLLRWTRPERPKLWENVKPIGIGVVDIGDFVPKIGSEPELQAWKALRSKQTYVLSSLSPSSQSPDSTLFCYSTAYNWLPFFRRDPASFADQERSASPSTRQFLFRSSEHADFFYACLVSSLSFWLWTVESDGFHITSSFVEKLPYSPDVFSSQSFADLCSLGRQHDETIRLYPMVKTNAGKRILNFNRHAATDIVEQIDSILISHLGISAEFAEVLQRRVRDLIFAGRSTTRVHAQ